MATDIKISQMPAASSLSGSEIIPIVLGGANKSTTVNKIKEGLATSQELANKVDKDGSKVLSDKNFTEAYETKLKGIADNANNYVLPAAGKSLGGVKLGVSVVDATSADDVITVVNALLVSLRNAGVIASAEPAVLRANTSILVIEFLPPMVIEKDKYYLLDGVTYKCIQSSKIPVENKLKDLVGYYVEIYK